MLNIGQEIKNELERQERSISWFARKLGCNRMTVYRIFSKNSIDTMMLIRISKLLNRNFFDDISKSIEDE